MTGFSGALGVVRVHLRGGLVVASLPRPVAAARELLDVFTTAVARVGDAAALLAFCTADGTDADTWIRARDVVVVDVVATEDPST